MNYDKTLLVGDNWRNEPKKYGGYGIKFKKSYRLIFYFLIFYYFFN